MSSTSPPPRSIRLKESRTNVHELAGARLTRDAGRGHSQNCAELPDLSRRDDASIFEDHSGTPTAKA